MSSSPQARSFIRSPAAKAHHRSIGFLLAQGAMIGLTVNAAQAQEVQAPAKADANLPTITVQGEKAAETATGPVSGYLAKRSATGTKTDTPLIETAKSITVITRDQMTDQAVQTSEQALRYTAGVVTEATGYDLRYQVINIRGFDSAFYLDGMRTFGSGSYGDWQNDPQGIERIEVLKGPASVLYGQGSPGGFANQVSKRPTANPVNEVGFSVGNHDRYEGTIDVGGQLNEDGSLLFRINGKARKSMTQTDYVKDDRLYIAPSITWRPSGRTSFTLLGDVTQDDTVAKSWWPDYAVITDQSKIPVSLFAGEPGFDHYKRDMASVTYFLEHQLTDDWTLRQNLRYSHSKLDYQQVFSNNWAASDPTHNLIDRGSLKTNSSGHAVTIDNQAETHLNFADFEHKVLLGLDYQKFSDTETSNNNIGTASEFDLSNPMYGLSEPDPVMMFLFKNRLRQVGVYAQDQIQTGPWVMNVGVRHDRANTKFTQAFAVAPDQSEAFEANDAKTTYNLSALRKFDNGLAPYASYSTSFLPGVGSRVFDPSNPQSLGLPTKPETGEQVEVGVKFQPKGSNSLFTASVFNLRKQNVVTEDDVNSDFDLNRSFVVQIGEVRARGLELEANTALTRQLNLITSYTYLDPKVTSTTVASELGKQPTQTTKHAAKVWLDYQLIEGWRIGGGVRYVGKMPADSDNSTYNKSYALFDAAIHYKTGPVVLALNAVNLFDKVYTANRGNFYGQARTLQANVTYRW